MNRTTVIVKKPVHKLAHILESRSPDQHTDSIMFTDDFGREQTLILKEEGAPYGYSLYTGSDTNTALCTGFVTSSRCQICYYFAAPFC